MKYAERGRKKQHKIICFIVPSTMNNETEILVYYTFVNEVCIIPNSFNIASNNFIRMQLKFNFIDVLHGLLLI
jgi:hypothetical protein